MLVYQRVSTSEKLGEQNGNTDLMEQRLRECQRFALGDGNGILFDIIWKDDGWEIPKFQ